MNKLCLFSLAFFVPTAAIGLTAQDKVDIANRLSQAYPAITVHVESTPVISGDQDAVLFRISPSGKANYGNLFLKGDYNIIYKPNAPGALGSYVCDIADEFVRERRSAQANFLPPFELKLSVSIRVVEFEIGGDRETLKGIVYAILTIWDAVKDDYGKFEILVRGYADQGAATFQRQLLPQYPYHDVSFFPLKNNPDPFMTVYLRTVASRKIGNTYTNTDLPNLRATFMKREVIDHFLDECRLRRPDTPKSFVLDGGAIDVRDPDYRTIDIYFYAYR
jgi:hypothetical protein